MDPLSTGLVCLLCAAQPSPMPTSVVRWKPLIVEAAARFEVPARWIERVMAQESRGLTTLNGQPITSSAGAMGLMQIMPATYSELRRRYGFGPNAYDPHDNILAGAAYLAELYRRYGYPNLFAAYNAGPSRLEAFLFGGRPLPDATTAYVAAITGAEIPSHSRPKSHAQAPSADGRDGLFFVNRSSQSTSKSPIPTSSLFVTPSTAQR
jgi:Transglycosylase SLT domain